MTIDEIADQVVDGIFAEKVRRQSEPGAKPMVKSDVREIVKAVLQRNLPRLVGAPGSEKPQPRKKNHGDVKRLNDMADEEFVLFLENQPHLQGVDVKREIGKCQLHFRAQTIEPSRLRIVKWVNKAERPLGYNGAGKSSFAPNKPDLYTAPQGWQESLLRLGKRKGWDNEAVKEMTALKWADVSILVREEILRAP